MSWEINFCFQFRKGEICRRLYVLILNWIKSAFVFIDNQLIWSNNQVNFSEEDYESNKFPKCAEITVKKLKQKHDENRYFVICNFHVLFVLELKTSKKMSVCLSDCLSECLSDYLSVCLTVCLPVYPTVCLSVCLTDCLSDYLSVWLSVWLSVFC